MPFFGRVEEETCLVKNISTGFTHEMGLALAIQKLQGFNKQDYILVKGSNKVKNILAIKIIEQSPLDLILGTEPVLLPEILPEDAITESTIDVEETLDTPIVDTKEVIMKLPKTRAKSIKKKTTRKKIIKKETR